MKRIFAFVAGILLAAGIACAQPRAIGVRTGWGHELSFQYGFKDYQFLQVDLGTVDFFPIGARLTGTYNFIFSQPQWTPRGEWAWFAGAGATLGIIHTEAVSTIETEVGPRTVRTDYNYLMSGIVPMFGLEYTFWFPLQLAVDIRPTVGFALGRKNAPMNGFYMDGITFGFIPTLSARYKF